MAKAQTFTVIDPRACRCSNHAIGGQEVSAADLKKRGLDVDALLAAGAIAPRHPSAVQAISEDDGA